ncbi:19315_t:CDS:2 [Cetraspora pellucida]|uniref:19315_t:CDS:1 n=1 Tax=Cetraspora pellucida TaxID=1433469 RepID=A0A9N9JYP0_9GLOM|nr:19315_t:CDS:2 [Cetraspora pellucida]
MNLRKKLKCKLRSHFEEFRQKFYVCQNSLCSELFEARWSHLVDQYLEVAKYMSETLYVNKKSWGISWICNQFTAVNINNYVKNEKHFEKFKVEHSALPTVGLPTLNIMLFRQIDDIMKKFLMPIMLGKQHLQMNQSTDYDDEEVNIGLQEQEQDIHQILFKSLIRNINQDEVLEYLEPNIDQRKLLQQTSTIKVCCTVRSEGIQPNITFENLFFIQPSSYNLYLTTKPKKAVYAELFGLSKKAIDLAIKSDISRKLVNTLKLFLNDVQDKNQQTNNDDNQIVINNPNIVKHKGQPSKRLKSNIEYGSFKSGQVLQNNINTTNIIKNMSGDSDNETTSVVKRRICGKCKQYGHYAKMYQA